MNFGACVTAVLASVATSASAQDFVNLDFDQALLPAAPPGFVALPWSQGAPGWGHADGDSTDVVTYPYGHAGYSQSYVLMQAPFGAASGLFGLGLHGGTVHEEEPHGGFVEAFISQTGRLAPQVRSVSLLASNFLFELTLDGTPIDMRPVGLDPTSPSYAEDLKGYWGAWTGDVSAFAGRVVELKITDLQTAPESPLLAVDQIAFLPLPEAPVGALLAAGWLAVLVATRRNGPNSRQDPAGATG